ncbi:hypothetical protein PHYC_03516 [Phycisphaerales bacterium]|nr:hypothetical protein PHYC_03516 [Phycisphaerales bacterium]
MPISANILIGLSSTSLRVARMSAGRPTHVERVPLDPADWAESWQKGLRPLEQALSGALAAAGVRPGARTRVVYNAPETVVDFCTVPVTGRPALQAARLMLRETLSDASIRLTALDVLAEDRAVGGESPEPSRTHVLLAAESASHAETLGAWIARAGLQVESLVPARAVVAHAALAACRGLPADGARAVVWLDDHSTILVARCNDRIQFIRSIDLGYASLAESVVRGSAAAGKPMDRSAAYRSLFTLGTPRRGQVIDPATGLKGEHLLPFMQSVLQRYLVETKQTLRFGLPESELARVNVHLTGPGANIPGVGEMFAGDLDWAVTRPDVAPTEDLEHPTFNDVAGELTHASGRAVARAALLPPTETARRADRGLARSVAVGAVLALTLVGVMYAQARRKIDVIEQRFAALEPRSAAVRAERDLRDHAASLAAELTGATRDTLAGLPPRPDWKAVLADLSHLTGAQVELAELSAVSGKDATAPSVLTVRGIAWPGEAFRQSDDALAAFLDRLSKSPLVQSARIVSTRSERADGREVKQFTITAQVQTLPTSIPEPVRTAGAPGGEP